MSLQNRLIGRSSQIIDQDTIKFDFDLFLQRILLFDTHILDSIRLKEIPYLINYFGYEGLMELLNSDVLKIQASANTIAQIGQSFIRTHQGKNVLPLGSFSFSTLQSADEKEYISSCLKITDDIESISTKQKIKLKHAVIDNLTHLPEKFGSISIEQMKSEVHRKDLVMRHINKVLFQMFQITNISDDVSIRIHQINEDDFLVESNLESLYHLSKEDSHKIIERALLGIGALNMKIEEMSFHNALSGFMGNEISLFEDKLNFIEEHHSPKKQETQIRRIFEIKDFPKFTTSHDYAKVDVHKLLEIQKSSECKAFREWLKTIDFKDEQEIRNELNNYRNKIASLANSKVGKTIRWLVGEIISPLEEMSGYKGMGMAYSALDSFVIDKLISQKGHIAFINDLYPSIFEKK
ncbi:hypothetical protein [Sulfurospirillum diekertiae]|uniref:Uncharacterized protein n=1 Tax=Sulfurospirillum diekertiae TaxID=1854492 RepID=A0A1Y0HR12_9BACT|nr:hypothetical protein [Sulfurospirillum diekertiae]ARU49976.1 hypothetical protein Sdiek1_2833 [Sulfurospirillum diekertiae]ASC94766.1 hypothetical protein Sdiek2_2769 [Sulfurospirillum diekertiae]